MGGRWVWVWSCVLLVTVRALRTPCPARCHCEDALRAASCANAGLDVVPIQLNPEATRINLTRNVISNIHFAFTFYDQLTTLDLSYNKIDTLGSKNFESNNALTQLNVSHNFIRQLEKATFVGLKRLMDLDLSNNEIAQVHSQTFRDLSNLERLDLTNNKLVTFDDNTFAPLESLRVLSLKNNGILNIPTSNLLYTFKIEILDMSDNLVQSIQRMGVPFLKELRNLDLNNNVIYDIDHLGFDNLPSLRHLDLSNNNMSVVPTVPLSKLNNLTHLFLSGNFFASIPAVSFQSLFHLKHLHLSRLHILDKIDARAFVDNINLEKIWMNDNFKVNEVPSRLFNGNPKLKSVFMKNNALETLDASHFPIDRLLELEIAGNPFMCNCSLLWLWKLGREYDGYNRIHKDGNESSVLRIDYAELKCASPQNLANKLLVEVPESEIRCSNGWMVVAAIVLTVGIVISMVGGMFYVMGPLKRRSEKSKQVMSSVMLNSDVSKIGNGLVYHTRPRDSDNKRDADRYLMIGSTVSNNFHSLQPPWHTMDKSPYHQDEPEENIYQQFTYETIPSHRTPEKPHIVYV